MRHVLVTNDYPPKLGGIQSYLFELWRRLPPERFAVLTIDHPAAAAFDAAAGHRIERLRVPMLLPTPKVREAIRRLADEIGAGLVVLDPALPLGLVGRSLGLPYAVLLHGAEVTVPARLPGAWRVLARVLSGASLAIAAGGYPAGEARRVARSAMPPTAVVPPGVDVGRFHPLTGDERVAARRRFGLPAEGRLVVSVSRLVPRKGMDVLIEAAAGLAPERPDLTVAIGGSGRDAKRLEALVRRVGAPVRLLGRVPDDELPQLYGAADVHAMLCRNRWLGLEQEGFGIVFLEAAASGVAQVAGRSGGADEAVLDGETGLVVDRPGDVVVASAALAALLDDEALRRRFGGAARRRAEAEFSYDLLARRLADALGAAGG
ncbi:MAG TPA: glycosyltransferase family 4 protein [Acidimicrobiales bacterium]|nr:glycosyltransferase family 4 protein [Acidimicrobiales bacterium]